MSGKDLRIMVYVVKYSCTDYKSMLALLFPPNLLDWKAQRTLKLSVCASIEVTGKT